MQAGLEALDRVIEQGQTSLTKLVESSTLLLTATKRSAQEVRSRLWLEQLFCRLLAPAGRSPHYRHSCPAAGVGADARGGRRLGAGGTVVTGLQRPTGVAVTGVNERVRVKGNGV